MKKILGGIGYWLVQLTWGGLMTWPGLLITGFVIVFLKGTPHRMGYSYIVEIGGDWGGLELGAVAMCGRYKTGNSMLKNAYWFKRTRYHEYGHTFQNMIFGPLMPFVVGIPSAIRYWYYRYLQSKNHKKAKHFDYYSIWFEADADLIGETMIF